MAKTSCAGSTELSHRWKLRHDVIYHKFVLKLQVFPTYFGRNFFSFWKIDDFLQRCWIEERLVRVGEGKEQLNYFLFLLLLSWALIYYPQFTSDSKNNIGNPHVKNLSFGTHNGKKFKRGPAARGHSKTCYGCWKADQMSQKTESDLCRSGQQSTATRMILFDISGTSSTLLLSTRRQNVLSWWYIAVVVIRSTIEWKVATIIIPIALLDPSSKKKQTPPPAAGTFLFLS